MAHYYSPASRLIFTADYFQWRLRAFENTVGDSQIF